jgi:hypothetical protein
MLTAPPRPLVAAPLPTRIQPLLPDTDVPVLNTIDPDTPSDSTSADDRLTEPLPLLVLAPDTIRTAPPVAPADDAAPPITTTSPPLAL